MHNMYRPGPGDGAYLIRVERQRQVEQEGFDSRHDDQHDDEDLAAAAACYAFPASWKVEARNLWPWRASDWKPTPEDRIGELVKAGALIAAEIDRLQRRARG